MQYNPTDAVRLKMRAIAEAIFHADEDPEQMPATEESWQKISSLSPFCLVYETDEKGESISWVLAIPTSMSVAENFLQKKINERELLQIVQPDDVCEALYVVAAITVPEHRGKGLASMLAKEIIKKFRELYPIRLIYAWPTSEEGKFLIQKLEKEADIHIGIRN